MASKEISISILIKTVCSVSRLLASVPHLSTSTRPSPNLNLKSPNPHPSHFSDVYLDGVRSGELSHDPLALARFLASCVVAYGRHFIVINKPANLSVYGHARSASPLISKQKSTFGFHHAISFPFNSSSEMCAYCFSEQWLISPVTPTEKSQGSLGRELALDPGVEGESLECIVGSEAFSDEGASSQSTPLSIYECLPHLREVLSESNPFSLTDVDSTSPLSVLVAKGKESQRPFSDVWSPPSEIFIVEPLPAAYSGLILLATTKAYAEFARDFYADATRNNFPGSMYQTFHVVCWGSPSRDSVENERFPIAIHKASESVSVAYRPTDDKVTSIACKKGTLIIKRIGHRILSRGSSQDSGCLIELVCNSCYAGLPEVYLLHEGCEVIGEDIQASRLVKTAGIPMVLPPTMAKLGTPVPTKLLKIFGVRNLLRSALPTHIHRSQLLIPPPLRRVSKGEAFSRRLPKPVGRIFSTQKSMPILSWKTYPVNEKKSVSFLSATSYSLPQYFIRTLEKLGLDIPFKHIDECGQ